jgi:TetR/AcrR family transcriptional repressor of nem operon
MRKDPEMSTSPSAKEKLLEAALSVIRTKGYAATTVDDLCRAAGVTKGAFFHHFQSKEELAVAAARYWSEKTSEIFASAPYHQNSDARDRVFAYLDFRQSIMNGALAEISCLVGTMVQETYATNPAIRQACDASISAHAATLAADISEAMEKHGVATDFSAQSLALFTQAALQGAFILAKAKNSPEIAVECVEHLRRYFEFLFNSTRKQNPQNRRDH